MNKRITGAIVGGVAVAVLGGGVAYAAAGSQPPTQTVRTGPDVADYCIVFGTNHIVYDWDQVQCPAGDYPLSFVSAPQAFSMALAAGSIGTGVPATAATLDCTLHTAVTDGTETDTYACTGAG